MSHYFDVEPAVGEMLMAEVLILNSPWWRNDWPESMRNEAWVVAVNCNDLFFGAADAQEVRHDEIEDLYTMWTQDKRLGHLAWCVKKRKVWPWPKSRALFDGSRWLLTDLIKKPADVHSLEGKQHV